MSKRVHEIAKERGLPAKEVLEKLRAAGINVKAVSSSVDEDAAAKALGNGGSAPTGANASPSRPARKSGDAKADAKAPAARPREAKAGDGKPADGARAPRGEAQAPAPSAQAKSAPPADAQPKAPADGAAA